MIVQPDLFFVAHDQDGIVKERVYGAPELVIEVLSPNPRVGSGRYRPGRRERPRGVGHASALT